MQDDSQPINIDSHGKPLEPKDEPPKKKLGLHHLKFIGPRQKWAALSKKHKIIVIAVALVVVLLGFLLAHSLLSKPSSPAISVTKKEKKSVTVASPLTGVQVAPDLAKRPVTGVMIENSLDARPQSGLQDAGVVFEAIAEGGITRFLALFQESRPAYVGPVRSLRPYYLDWATSFDASVAHVGGSPDALSQIRNGGKDLDQFFNAGSYWRVSSRAAPHNVFTSFDKLDALNQAKGYSSSKFTPWPRKSDQKLATPTARTIDIAISSSAFNVHYDWDQASNDYFRYEGGAKHIATHAEDDQTGSILAPQVVIAMIMPYGIDADGEHSDYGVNGSGPVFVFQDGGVTTGTWNKPDRASMITFKDSQGQVIKLNSGQTWITAAQDGQVSYAP